MCRIAARSYARPDHRDPEPRREWTLPAEARSVAVIRAGVREFARDVGVSEDALAAIALAVSEAVTNGVVHAFVGRPPGIVNAVGEAAKDEFVVRVADDGRGMQPRPDSPGLGMGLPLIGQMASSLDILERADSHGTEICMTFATPGVRGPSRAPLDPVRVGLLESIDRL